MKKYKDRKKILKRYLNKIFRENMGINSVSDFDFESNVIIKLLSNSNLLTIKQAENLIEEYYYGKN